MPVLFHFRMVSDNDVIVAPDRATAVGLALSGGPPDPSATIISQFPTWPKLNNYTNDNGLGIPPPEPQFIWDSSVSDGQSRGFATILSNFSFGSPTFAIINLVVFTDNAHEAVIEVYNRDTQSVEFTLTPAPLPLIDGNMDPATGYTETQPYNWQTVRFYSNHTPTFPIGTSLALVLSFRVVNYNVIPPLAINPAGLAFIADLYFID